MQALTIQQPWAHAIVYGTKRIENRSWAPSFPIGTTFAIHAARNVQRDVDLRRINIDASIDQLTCGAIVGVARFGGVVDRELDVVPSQRVWWLGPRAWLLSDVVAFAPISCSGARSVWEIPSGVLRTLRRRLDELRGT